MPPQRGGYATIASIEQLSQIEARRLQLAAERGGGIGLFMRTAHSRASANYAAATRWLVQPARGAREFNAGTSSFYTVMEDKSARSFFWS